MLEKSKKIFCTSRFASKNARVEIDQFQAGWVWLTIYQTRNGEEIFSEFIRIRLADLRQILSTFKE